MAGKYQISFGPKDNRNVKAGLKQEEVIAAYDRLVADGESEIDLISPNGEILDAHQFRLNLRTGWGRL